MLAAVFGQRDFAATRARAPIVEPGVLEDGEHPARQVRARPELPAIEQRALDGHLREVVGIVLVARQGARETAQSRQQGDEAITDFLRGCSHAFMKMIRPARSFSSMRNAAIKRVCLLAASLAVARLAGAQLPQVQVPSLPQVPGVQVPGLPEATRAVGGTLRDLTGARALRIDQLARQNRAELDRVQGELVVRAEVVAIDITRPALERALAEKFLLKRTRQLAELGVEISVLQTPEGWSASRGLKRLRKLD